MILKTPTAGHRRTPRQADLTQSFSAMLHEVISSSKSTCFCISKYFSRTVPRRHGAQKCVPRLPDDLQNESQINTKHHFSVKRTRCVSKVPKNMKNIILLSPFYKPFWIKNSDVILSLNSTCSCLYVYFSRTLPRWHLDTQMCPKAAKWVPKNVRNRCKTWFFFKVSNVCFT